MGQPDLLTLCRATPFRPFRVHTHDNQTFDIAAASQVGISPGERLFIVVLADARFEVVVPERIARCEIIMDGMPRPPEPPPPAATAESKLSAGGISFLSFTTTDGRGMVQFAASDAEGNPILSSAGTRWDVHAMETFENGRSLYIHHIDDLTLTRRIIIWPPTRATFESFAEAMDVDELQKVLHTDSAASNAKGFSIPKGYFKSIIPEDPYIPPMPKFPLKPGQIAPDDPMRFVMSAKRYDAAPGVKAVGPAVTDLLTEHVMFDLEESGWDASIEDAPSAWELTLRFPTAPGRELKLGIDGFKALARLGESTLSLEAAERHLRNFPLHNSWDTLVELLTGEPRDLKEPEVIFRHESGAMLELWPGKANIPAPFLTPRIVDAGGRTILDCRGSQWGALARVHGSGIALNLLHADVKTRLDFTPRLNIALSSHRVTSDEVPGATCLVILQDAIQKCRTPEWMLEDLTEWFGKGKDIPIPGSVSV